METTKRSRIVIVEDQVMVAEFLAAICLELGHQVVAKFQTCAAARAALPAIRADLVLLDISLPDGDGLTLVPEFFRAQPKVRIVAISGRVNDYAIVEARRHGVHGFIDKTDQSIDLLKTALTDVLAGKNYYAPVVEETLKNPRAFNRLLNKSQIQILALIGEAKSDEEIAALTGKVASTIQSRRRDIMAKLNLHSTAKLMHYAITQGITTVPAGKMLQSPSRGST